MTEHASVLRTHDATHTHDTQDVHVEGCSTGVVVSPIAPARIQPDDLLHVVLDALQIAQDCVEAGWAAPWAEYNYGDPDEYDAKTTKAGWLELAKLAVHRFQTELDGGAS